MWFRQGGEKMTETVLWKGAPITDLTVVQQRQALADAVSEIDFSRKTLVPDDVFTLVLLSSLAGVVTALVCLGLPQLVLS